MSFTVEHSARRIADAVERCVAKAMNHLSALDAANERIAKASEQSSLSLVLANEGAMARQAFLKALDERSLAREEEKHSVYMKQANASLRKLRQDLKDMGCVIDEELLTKIEDQA